MTGRGEVRDLSQEVGHGDECSASHIGVAQRISSGDRRQHRRPGARAAYAYGLRHSNHGDPRGALPMLQRQRSTYKMPWSRDAHARAAQTADRA
jgi:hypothetical protein